MKKLFLSLSALVMLVSLVLVFTIQPIFADGYTVTTTGTQLSLSQVQAGQSVTDTATVTGHPSVGTVTFSVKLPGGSTFAWYDTQNVVNGQATSNPYTTTITGTYYFKASYSGYDDLFDGFLPSTSGDQDEPLTVTSYSPPLPELPAGALFGIGLCGVGGFVMVKRHRRAAAIK